RQQPDCEHAEEGDDDADDDREDGPPDEEIAGLFTRAAVHLVAPNFAVSSGDAVTLSGSGTGRTGRPGAAFWVPSTTTRSPAFRPLSMIQRWPLQGPGWTSRAATVSP